MSASSASLFLIGIACTAALGLRLRHLLLRPARR